MARASVKEQLVTRSAPVFLERGFNAASVNDIVQAAGVPKGSFYNHFVSKEQLAVEVLGRYVDDLGLRELADPSGSPLEQIRGHLTANIAAREAAGIEYGCLLGNFSTDAVALNEGLRGAVTAGFARWTDAMASAIARAQRANEIRNDTDAHTLARYVVSSFEGAIAQAKTQRIDKPIRDFLAVTFGTVLQ
jgi:TetR/AcrR family transcriptional repressor of nem operon